MYHGSLEDISGALRVNKPFETYFYKPAVYLTQKKELAILHALNPIRIYAKDRGMQGKANAFSCHFRNVLTRGIITVCECYEGMFDELSRQKVYLYSVEIDDQIDDYDDFAYCKDIHFQSKEIVTNVKDFLLQCQSEGKIKLIRYGDLTEREKYLLFDSIASRANACESEIEIAFFKDKFPDNIEVQTKLYLNKKTL